MIPSWEDLIPLTPAYVRHETDIDIPDTATEIRVHRESVRHRPVGEPVKKLIPDQRYNLWRHPTYTEIEEQKYVSEVLVSWRVGKNKFAAWAQLKER